MIISSLDRFLTPYRSNFLENSLMSIVPDLSVSIALNINLVSELLRFMMPSLLNAYSNYLVVKFPSLLPPSKDSKAYFRERLDRLTTEAILEKTCPSKRKTGSKVSSRRFKTSSSSSQSSRYSMSSCTFSSASICP